MTLNNADEVANNLKMLAEEVGTAGMGDVEAVADVIGKITSTVSEGGQLWGTALRALS